jgi:hypothetical protein
LGEEEAAAAAGGGGRCCWGEDASSLSASRGWAVSVPITERVSPCSYIYPSGAMLSSPSPPGVRGRAVCDSFYSCHYPSWATPIAPSPPGVRGRAARDSFYSCHYPSWATPIAPSPLGVRGRAARDSFYSCHYPSWATPIAPSPPGVRGRAARVLQSVRVLAGLGSGPGRPGPVRVRPTWAVARAFLGRRGCGRQSASRPGLRVRRDGSRVAPRGRCPRGRGLGAVRALVA